MRQLSFITFLVLFSANAFAGLLLEPYVGYGSFKNSGTVEIGALKGDLEETTAKGLMYGGRVGYGIANLAVGLDYGAGSLDDDGDTTKITQLGAFVMASFPIVRVWGTYIFSGKEDITSDDADLVAKGAGFKFGVGFSVLPMLSLNAEYVMMNFDEVDSDTVNAIDMDIKGFLISISIPFVL